MKSQNFKLALRTLASVGWAALSLWAVACDDKPIEECRVDPQADTVMCCRRVMGFGQSDRFEEFDGCLQGQYPIGARAKSAQEAIAGCYEKFGPHTIPFEPPPADDPGYIAYERSWADAQTGEGVNVVTACVRGACNALLRKNGGAISQEMKDAGCFKGEEISDAFGAELPLSVDATIQ